VNPDPFIDPIDPIDRMYNTQGAICTMVVLGFAPTGLEALEIGHVFVASQPILVAPETAVPAHVQGPSARSIAVTRAWSTSARDGAGIFGRGDSPHLRAHEHTAQPLGQAATVASAAATAGCPKKTIEIRKSIAVIWGTELDNPVQQRPGPDSPPGSGVRRL